VWLKVSPEIIFKNGLFSTNPKVSRLLKITKKNTSQAGRSGSAKTLLCEFLLSQISGYSIKIGVLQDPEHENYRIEIVMERDNATDWRKKFCSTFAAQNRKTDLHEYYTRNH
jgi:hypothetical protein